MQMKLTGYAVSVFRGARELIIHPFLNPFLWSQHRRIWTKIVLQKDISKFTSIHLPMHRILFTAWIKLCLLNTVANEGKKSKGWNKQAKDLFRFHSFGRKGSEEKKMCLPNVRTLERPLGMIECFHISLFHTLHCNKFFRPQTPAME